MNADQNQPLFDQDNLELGNTEKRRLLEMLRPSFVLEARGPYRCQDIWAGFCTLNDDCAQNRPPKIRFPLAVKVDKIFWDCERRLLVLIGERKF